MGWCLVARRRLRRWPWKFPAQLALDLITTANFHTLLEQRRRAVLAHREAKGSDRDLGFSADDSPSGRGLHQVEAKCCRCVQAGLGNVETEARACPDIHEFECRCRWVPGQRHGGEGSVRKRASLRHNTDACSARDLSPLGDPISAISKVTGRRRDSALRHGYKQPMLVSKCFIRARNGTPCGLTVPRARWAISLYEYLGGFPAEEKMLQDAALIDSDAHGPSLADHARDGV